MNTAISLKIPGFFYLIIILLMAGCSGNSGPRNAEVPASEHAIRISGTVEGGSGKDIILEKMNAREYIPLDTVQCDEQGDFEIEFEADQVSFYALRTCDRAYITLLLEAGEKISFNGTYCSSDNYTVKGSNGSELIRELARKHKNTIKEMAEISKQNKASLNHPDYQSIKLSLDSRFDSLATDFYEYSLDFIHRNSSSLAILIALYNQYGYGLPVFNTATDLEVFEFVDSSLSKYYPGNDAVNLLHAQIESISLQTDKNPGEQGLKIGDTAPDFVMKDQDGLPLALSSFRGSYTLLSFWAAWSTPGREENKYLKQLSGMYDSDELIIFQVSIDENEKLWKQTIENDSLDWYHASDLVRWESKVNDMYFLEKIPANFLIDPDGKIIKMDLFGQDLINELKMTLQ